MKIDKLQLDDMQSQHRAAFVNSLSGFKSANLVGTCDDKGQTNLAVMSSAVHIGSSPALLALVIRPGGAERHTLANILATGVYTLNHVSLDMISRAHQTAARYARQQSEFECCGFSACWHETHAAPFVADASVQIAMQLREHQQLAINQTHLVIGEVKFVVFPQDALRRDGSLDLVATETAALSGLDSYHRVTLHKRMAYAKPDQPPRQLPD
jgi:flavin reductase (DIM6/NTAB) family NADH-FMN oxidoreductase RutF